MKENKKNQDQTSNDVREALNDQESKIEQNFANLRRELTDAVPSVRGFLEKHPMGSAATVLATGVVVGYWIAGRKRKGISRGRWLLNSALETAEGYLDNRDVLHSPLPVPGVKYMMKEELPSMPSTLAYKTRQDSGYSRPTSPGAGKGVFGRLVNMVVPMVIEKGLKALEKNGSEDDTG